MSEVKLPIYAYEEISACLEVIKRKSANPRFFTSRQQLREIHKFADMAEKYLMVCIDPFA